MKKVVYVAQSAGGVAEYLYMLLNNMEKDKYENILIVSNDYKEQISRFRKIVKHIYFIPMKREIDFKSDINSIFKLKKILKEINPDIVYLNSSKAGAIGRIAMLFSNNIKIIYNAHGWYFNAKIGKTKSKIYAFIEKILAIKTNKIINISRSEYDSAIEKKIANKKKMCIIENGIDFFKFKDIEKYRQETRKLFNIKDDEILIGIVGRIDEQKDPIASIKAFKLVYDINKKVKIMFVGSGNLEKEILEIAKKYNLEKNVFITGWVNKTEKYISAFDIAMLPSKWEGFGLAIIEYMACKKPIIATAVGGINEIMEYGKRGTLVKNSSPEDLSKDIIITIENKNINRQIIQDNYEYALKKYNISNVVQKHINVFED